MEPPWILVICHEFPPLGGGAGHNLSLLCRELSRRGHKVKVWTADPGAGNRQRHEVEVAYLRAGRRGRFETSLRGMLIFALKAAAKAWGLRKSGRPALVLSCLGIPAGLAGTAASRWLGVPHAVWYHGSDVHGGRPQGCGFLQRLLIRRVAGSAAHNLFISAGLREMALAFASAPGAAILPSCPSPEITAAAAAQEGASPAAEAGYFLFLGRLEPVKNPFLALKAISLLREAGKTPPPLLRMVGGGRLRDDLRAALRSQALAGRATLEPAAGHGEVPGLLRGALALVVPSRVEGFNTTILEAARFGVPTVGSDVVGVRDFVRDGETGLLFPEGDAAALARALERIASDRALREALGNRARAASRPYRPDRVADLFLEAVGSDLPSPPADRHVQPGRPVTPPEEAPACP